MYLNCWKPHRGILLQSMNNNLCLDNYVGAHEQGDSIPVRGIRLTSYLSLQQQRHNRRPE